MKRYRLPALLFSISLTLVFAAFVQADADVAERIDELSVRIDQLPNDQSLRLQRSLAYAENNQWELAQKEILAAESVGNSVDAAFTHGVLLFNRGDYVSARPYFDRYLQAYPLHRRTLDYRARLLRDLNESRAALADYIALIELSNTLDPGYYLATARLMASLPDHGVDEALELLDERMLQRGPISSLQRYAILLEKSRGHFEAAIERTTAMDQRLKATPQWKVELAELLLSAGRSEEASAYLSVAEEQLRSGTLPGDRALLAHVDRMQNQIALHQNQVPDETAGRAPQ